MKNLWNDAEAEKLVEHYAAKGVGRDLALRVYTTRLLGGDPRLVLHGGGNTSVKTKAVDLVGDEWDVLCVKGSGWDMGVIEPQGLPAVKLGALLKARKLPKLSDEDMVALQRANLIDPSSPNPSVETLLHAFLPHKFVDHTHSTAVLGLVDQENSEEICRKVYGKTFGFVPYIMPGFDLAKAAAEVFEQDTSVEGLILDKHGIFTFGDDARQAYDRMIGAVTRAEDYIAAKAKPAAAKAALPAALAKASDIAPMLRGAVAVAKGEGRFDRMIGDFRVSDAILDFLVVVEDCRLRRAAASRRPISRSASRPGRWRCPRPTPKSSATTGRSCKDHVAKFAADYRAYFETHDALDDVKRTMLDQMPRLSARARRRHVRPWPHAEGREDRVRCRRDVDRSGARRRGDRRFPPAVQGRSVSARILVAGAGQARLQQAEAADWPGHARHRRRRRDRCGNGKALRRQWRACGGRRSRRRQG